MNLKKSKAVLAGLLCASMLWTSFGVQAADTKTADDYFTTSISSYKDTVTVSLSLEKNSKLTSADTVIYYDDEVMELTDVIDVSSIGLTDVNEAYENGDKKGVSFAWASDKEVTKGGQILTLSFKVKNATDKEEISVETDTLDAYANGEALALSEEENVVSTTLSIPSYNSNSNIGNFIDRIVNGSNRIGNILKGLFGWN